MFFLYVWKINFRMYISFNHTKNVMWDRSSRNNVTLDIENNTNFVMDDFFDQAILTIHDTLTQFSKINILIDVFSTQLLITSHQIPDIVYSHSVIYVMSIFLI